jgi:small GTP-binding protein
MLGVEFLTKVVTTNSRHIQLQLWDTRGHEIFRSITRSYYQGAVGALVVFDLTSHDSFVDVDRWIQDVRDTARPDLVMVLVGNKTDLSDARQVQREEAQQYADRHGVTYFETSAKTGDNVLRAVTAVVLEIERRVDAGTFSLAPDLEPMDFQPKKAENRCRC